MRHGQYVDENQGRMNWGLLRRIWPLLMENRLRVLLALGCLLLAKGAILTIPFLLKDLVDNLEIAQAMPTEPALLLGLVVAYGAARFANVFLSLIHI